jgi:serine/threonine protein kinase
MQDSREVIVALRRKTRAASTEVFPGFTDVFEIGTGSLATVYRAREIDTNRHVALKLLNVRDASPRALESFQRESIALGALSAHPNIVTLFRTFPVPDGRPVLVLELCSYAISDRLRGGSQLPVQEAVAIAVKVAGALETAHRAQILHRDVKPQNILVTEFGEPALADFGVAMLQSSTQTTAGLFDFTTLHAAPELLEGGATSAATDVYELASTLYQLIVGQSAFRSYDGESPASVILRILRDPVQPVVAEGVPVALSDLLIWAMSKDKDHRPPTAAEFAVELSAIETDQGWPRTQFLIRDTANGAGGGPNTITRMPDRPVLAVPPAAAAPAAAAPMPVVLPWIAPTPAEPTWTEPTRIEPTSVEPTSTEPTPSEPTPVEPTATEPSWSQPTWSEPTWSAPSAPVQPADGPPPVELVAPEPVAEPVAPEPIAEPVAPEPVAESVVPEPGPPVGLEPDWRALAARRRGSPPAHAAPSSDDRLKDDAPAAVLEVPAPQVAHRPAAGSPEAVWAPPPAGVPAPSAPAPEPPPLAPPPPSESVPYPLRPPRPPMPVAGLPGRTAWTAPPPPPPTSPPPPPEPPPLPPRAEVPPAVPVRSPEPADALDLLPWPEPQWTEIDTGVPHSVPPAEPPVAPPTPGPGPEVSYPIPPAGMPALPDQDTFGAPAAALRVPRPARMQQFGGDIQIDPMSLRPRLRLHAGLSALTVDERRVSMRVGVKRSKIPWTDVLGFEPRVERVDDDGVPSGSLIALTTTGPVELPATRGSLAEVRYAHAMLDAYRARAQLAQRSR